MRYFSRGSLRARGNTFFYVLQINRQAIRYTALLNPNLIRSLITHFSIRVSLTWFLILMCIGGVIRAHVIFISIHD